MPGHKRRIGCPRRIGVTMDERSRDEEKQDEVKLPDEQKARQVQEQEMEDLEPRSEDTANVTAGKSNIDPAFIRR